MKQERAFYTVAAMLAAQPPAARGQPGDNEENAARAKPFSLGESLAQAVRRAGRGLAEGSAEKRLHLLTRQSLDGLHQQLPSLVRHLRQLDIAVDWIALMNDLIIWPYARDRIAKRWLQDFYTTLHQTVHEE